MESSARSLSSVVNELENRLKSLHTTRIHDEQTFNELELLLDDCSKQLNRLLSSSDPHVISVLLPSLIHIIISLTKICSDKSDVIVVQDAYLSRDKLSSLITTTKTLYNQIKEFIKLPKLNTILIKSTHLKYFCEQLRFVCDRIGNADILTTLLCHKLIVKLLTGSDDQQQSSYFVKSNDSNDNSLMISVYQSVLQQLGIICSKYFPDKSDIIRDASTTKMYVIYFQMINKLLQYNDVIFQIETYKEFLHIMFQLHVCLESTCQQNRFQFEFFNNTIGLQDILEYILVYSLKHSNNTFFHDLFTELTNNKYKYASLIFIFRLIDAYNNCSIKQTNKISNEFCHRLISNLFDLIDQCRMQLILPALLPMSFYKVQVEYGSLYDITYSYLLKFFQYQTMQTCLSSMTKLLESYNENSTIVLTSIQLASELIIQTWFLYNQSIEYQYLFALFLSELIRLDIHSNLSDYLLSITNIHFVKYLTYHISISSDKIYRLFDFYSILNEKKTIDDINHISLNISSIYPTNIEHLYSFIRLFNTELNSNQIQYIIDTCIYSIQQFLSLTIITEIACQHFILIIKILNSLIVKSSNENLKCLLGQLTQIFIILDEQTAFDIRLELLRLFTIHSNLLDDNDLGRLLDFMLTSSVEFNSNSISFHIGCLNVVESLRQRSSRTSNITDLLIQLIVRYGNESQSNHILKVHLMRVFLAYISDGNDDSLVMRVKSQCALLRANIDEFEKNKKSLNTTDNHFPDGNILKILDNTQSIVMTSKGKTILTNQYCQQLKFYQMIINEMESVQSIEHSNSMQQD